MPYMIGNGCCCIKGYVKRLCPKCGNGDVLFEKSSTNVNCEKKADDTGITWNIYRFCKFCIKSLKRGNVLTATSRLIDAASTVCFLRNTVYPYEPRFLEPPKRG
uniref:Uncharacterized protein n=1 Tax=Rhizophagus irregularis (strain DAOM 181602 / DAOM 197198 / MUCL 43194) TaxID=747089 RepID=U9V379_RHIID